MKKRECKVVFYKDRRGEWRWRFHAKNGRVLADSGEGYKRIGDADRAYVAVRTNVVEIVRG